MRFPDWRLAGRAIVLAGALATTPAVWAQQAAPANPPHDDGRAQYPAGLANSFFSINVGYIGYNFSDAQLEPGYAAGSIVVPHAAARAVLFGHNFTPHLAVQGSYLRPVQYVKYRNLNGSTASGSVWMHFGTVTVQARAPIASRLALYAEGGLAITNRDSLKIGEAIAMTEARFASPIVGGGLEYRLSPSVDLLAGTSFIPRHSSASQPATMLASGGVRYTMRPLPAEQVAETIAAGFIFPKHLLQVGYATDKFGFAVNNFVSQTVPVFWGGHVEVKHSVVSLQYQRNLFHTKKIFSFDVGTSFGSWRTEQEQRFFTISAFPLARFTFLRTKPADVYFGYAVAGPTYISRVVIDGLQTGSHFTFQDFMALGTWLGAGRRVNFELNLNHYSNGNMMPQNAGVKVPLALKVGVGF